MGIEIRSWWILGSILCAAALVHGVLAEAAGRRVALVIGNGVYADNPLQNPRHDAEDMAALLERTGFSVMLEQDLDRRGMARSISRLARMLEQEGSVGVFYYAGHGVEVDGRNFLLPVDMQIDNVGELEFEAIDVQRLLNQMHGARNGMNIVILDASRNNPFPGLRGASGERGIKRIGNAPLGSLIASSTASGEVAAGGAYGRNSPYTRQLLRHLDTPGLSLEQAFKRVRRGVLEETHGAQVPWEMSSLTADFYFREGARGPDFVVCIVARGAGAVGCRDHVLGVDIVEQGVRGVQGVSGVEQ